MTRKTRIVAAVLVLASMLFSMVPASASIEKLYYIDAKKGHYYAIETGGTPLRAFYMQDGRTVYIPTYWWKANHSYVIFKSPCSCRIYLREEPSLELTELDTITFARNLTNKDFFIINETKTVSVIVKHRYSGSWIVLFKASATVNASHWRLFRILGESFNGTHYIIKALLISQETSLLNVTKFSFPMPLIIESPKSTFIADWFFVINTKNCGTIVTKQYILKPTYKFKKIYVLAYVDGSHYKLLDSDYVEGTSCQARSHTLVIRVAAEKVYRIAFPVATLENYNFHVVSLATLPTDNMVIAGSEASYYLFAARVESLNTTLHGTLVIPINASVELRNPAVYIEKLDMWIPAEYRDSLLIIPLPSYINVTSFYIVANYPLQIARQQVDVVRIERADELLAYIPGRVNALAGIVNGTLKVGAIYGSTIIWHGNLALSNVYHIEYARMEVNNESYTVLYIDTPYAEINATIEGDGWIVRGVRPQLDYIKLRIGEFELKEFPVSKIDVIASSAKIVGAWEYRIPVYITLSYLPRSLTDTGYLFRLELPIGDWIRAGLLSPALEDLLIVDSSMQPLPFAIIKNDGERAVVYVRYTRPLLSQSIVIYILLKNKQLWGTGNSFASLTATFDRINPAEGVDDLGWSYDYSYMVYNMWLFIGNATIAAGPTVFDFVAWSPAEGTIYEQHGNLITRNITVNATSGDEVLVLFSNNFNDALVYVNGKPWYSIPLGEFNNTSPAYYIKWKGEVAVYAGKMIPYSYSLGQISGSMEQPARVEIQQPGPEPQKGGASMWDLFASMMPLLLIAIVIRLIRNPPAPAYPYPR